MSLNLAELDLTSTPFVGCVHHLATTHSTNTLALEAAQRGVETGVWVADEQTAGRGRGGHAWHSAPGDGLYVSVLARPRLLGPDALKLSLAAGLAAQAAIAAATGMEIDIRWPNDLMSPAAADQELTQKKLGGILTETAVETASGALQYAVIGIGINLHHAEFPPELAAVATSLQILCGRTVSREAVLGGVLRALWAELSSLEQGLGGLLERFEAASSWVWGLRVRVEEEDGYTGVTAGLDARGLLRVRLEDGSVRTVRHGGVRRI